MRRLVSTSVALALLVGLSGCTGAPQAQPGTPAPAPTGTAPTGTAQPGATASPSPTAEPSEVEQARERFDAAIAALVEANADPGGREVVDVLAAAGFDKSTMEVTPDTTAIGLDADSIQFSVLVDGECIVGQSGNVGYHSAVLPVLSTGTCLVGNTRAIDW